MHSANDVINFGEFCYNRHVRQIHAYPCRVWTATDL